MIFITYTDWNSGFRVIERFNHRSTAIKRIKALRSIGPTDAHIADPFEIGV